MPVLRFEMEQDIGPNPLRKYPSSGHRDKTASQLNAIVAIGFCRRVGIGPNMNGCSKIDAGQSSGRRLWGSGAAEVAETWRPAEAGEQPGRRFRPGCDFTSGGSTSGGNPRGIMT